METIIFTPPSPYPDARDWNGPNDSGNPRNFSTARKVFSTVAYTGLAFVSTLAASLYAASREDVKAEFNTTEEISILPLSLYNLGMAFGPLIGSPLSETAGRRVVVLVTTPIFALFILGSGFSNSVVSLNICRFFAGAVAAPAIGNASATICDYTAGRYRSVVMSFYYAIPTFGAVLGPLVGGFVVHHKSWRWTQWTTVFFIVAFYVPVLFTRETYKKTILQRRAMKYNIEGPPVVQRTTWQWTQYFVTVLFLRPAHMLVTETIVTLVCMYSGFLFGLMYSFVIASPWVYEYYYDFDLTGQSLSFLGLILGALLAPLPQLLLDHVVYQPRLKAFVAVNGTAARFPPEYRLFPAMIASPLLPTFLILFAWTAQYRVHWACPIIFQSLAMMASVVIYAPSNLFMIDAYGPLYGASAAGAAMLSRYTLSAAFPLFSLPMYEALGVGWATTLLAAFTAVMAPIPWLFYKYGERIRSKGKYETSD
ncbi:Putative major facilitator superfamily, MFS transporter superfamily [Septoria linicola]|uniref:Major facilitator superfamily, MFS transporter superfamily n=1 Tax=Septoria linicola TaxID=215465 RepID=A0A9Q9EHP4_9PEZI|nr:Putative major facilitator superfamily, MFS transporter superfamily [Septoria linicola]